MKAYNSKLKKNQVCLLKKNVLKKKATKKWEIFKDAQYKKNLLKKLNEAIHKCNSNYNIICVKNIIKKIGVRRTAI